MNAPITNVKKRTDCYNWFSRNKIRGDLFGV